MMIHTFSSSRMLAGGAMLALACSLTACNTVTLPPADNASANAVAAGARAPVVDASIRNDQPAMGNTAAVAAAGQAQAPAAAGALQGLYLQAGTFSTQANADAAASKVRSKMPALAQKVNVAPRGANFRVLIGPFADDKERQTSATAIRTQTGGAVANAAP